MKMMEKDDSPIETETDFKTQVCQMDIAIKSTSRMHGIRNT